MPVARRNCHRQPVGDPVSVSFFRVLSLRESNRANETGREDTRAHATRLIRIIRNVVHADLVTINYGGDDNGQITLLARCYRAYQPRMPHDCEISAYIFYYQPVYCTDRCNSSSSNSLLAGCLREPVRPFISRAITLSRSWPLEVEWVGVRPVEN